MKKIKEFLGKYYLPIAVVAAVACIGVQMVMICIVLAMEKPVEAKDEIVLKDEPTVHYYDLEYAEYGGDVLWRHLCTELAAEDKCNFKPERLYGVRFELPKEMVRDHPYEVEVVYDYTVSENEVGYIQMTITDSETGEIYIARSAYGAEEEIYLQHLMDQTDKGQPLTGFLPCGDTAYLILTFSVTTALIDDTVVSEFDDVLGHWTIVGIKVVE